MDRYICYIDPSNRTIRDFLVPEVLEKFPTIKPVYFEDKQIYFKGETVRGKIILSTSEGRPLYAVDGERALFIWYRDFIDMLDYSQRKEYSEWFYTSEWVEYTLYGQITKRKNPGS